VVKARYTLTGPLKGGLEFLGVVVIGTGIGLAVNLILTAIARPG
jgi:hypothetical protein